MGKNDIKYIFPIIILLIIISGGLYYNNQNKVTSSSTNTNVASNDQGGIVLGDDTTGASTGSDQITEGALYNQKVLSLRQTVNKGFEDISAKSKYTTLFTADDMQKLINDTRSNIENAISELDKINIADKLRDANNKHLESLKLLLEAISAYDSSKKTDNKTEAQRLTELYAYNIDKSNTILKGIQIPQ
ncbi:MAG: hypothetical protein ACD_58C00035G0007 [uncultured bacterium]|nr:MAG: hypothetical protein ACD_58C00035G0007 [uncultured bacterium]